MQSKGENLQVDSEAQHLEHPAVSAEVAAFMEAIPTLTQAQWEEVGGRRRLVASVVNESAEHAISVRAHIAAIKAAGQDTLEVPGLHADVLRPLHHGGLAMLEALEVRTDEEVVAAWHAFASLVRRRHLPPIRFAASYAPMAAAIAIPWPRPLVALLQRYLAAIEKLSTEQCELLARPKHIPDQASSALSRAANTGASIDAEESTALTAVISVPTQLPGDLGWAAAKTLTFGGRVLGCIDLLSTEDLNTLWASLQEAIPLASVLATPAAPKKAARVRAAPAPKAPRATKAAPAEVASAPEAATAGARKVITEFGPNSVEVAAFLRDVRNLAPGQWRRIADRRQMVASVTNEGTAEPATVVRSLLATIRATADMPADVRCKVYVAAERGADVPEPDDSPDAWQRFADGLVDVKVDVVEPMANAGAALVDFLGGRTDAEVVATWHAVSALVRHHHLSPVKFAVSYAPFSAALPIPRKTPLGAPVERYLTVIGRLSANQCAALAKTGNADEEASRALSAAVAQGEGRAAEEEAAMAAAVAVPMRMTGNAGWAAVKAAALGGRILGCRTKLTPAQLEALWKPINAAIPLSLLEGG